jgi:predicted anti-sigma-YlaC factor YlaD
VKCSEAVERIILLDRGEKPSAELVLHMQSCAACRSAYQGLSRLERRASLVAGEPRADDTLTRRVMVQIRDEAILQAEEEHPVRLRGWTVGGAIILASLVLIQFSKVVAWLGESMGAVVDVALGIMLGIALTIYICMLVWSNPEAIRRFLHLRIR